MTVAVTSDDEPTPTIGELIAERRERLHMSRPTLALRAGVSLSSVKNWETGRVKPSAAHLEALEKVMGVRFVDDGAGTFTALDTAPEAAPEAPRVVVLNASTAEAVEAAFKWLGVPRAD